VLKKKLEKLDQWQRLSDAECQAIFFGINNLRKQLLHMERFAMSQCVEER